MIEANALTKSFAHRRAVDGVTLRVEPGELYGLVGADGAGKTTLIRMLVGALRPDGGSSSIAGCDMVHRAEEARARLGYLSQRFSLYEDLSVLENIRFFAEVRGMKSSEWLPRCMELLEFVGLAGFRDRRAGQLSGGMRQKLGLASALVTRPQVLLLDEPTTGVDPVTRQDFWQLLVALVSPVGAPAGLPTGEGGINAVAVLLTTPYMDEAARCHRVGFLRQGRLIAEDAPSKLRSMLDDQIIELRGSPLTMLRRVAEADAGVAAAHSFGNRLHLRLAPGAGKAVLERLVTGMEAQGGKVEHIGPLSPSLEDVFIFLSERSNE